MPITPADYFKKDRLMTVDEYLEDSPLISVRQYLQMGPEQQVPEQVPVPGTSFFEGAGNFLTQGLIGAIDTGTFGALKLQDKFAPANTGEAIGRGIGSLVGMAAGPLKAGGMLTRGLGPAVKAGLGGGKAATAIANVASNAAPLALAEGMISAGETGGDIKAIRKAASAGALMGATFGVTQLLKPQNAIIGQLARQFGGRALLAVTGQVEYEEALKQPNIAQTVWQEILNTWFFRYGISLEEVATGKFKDPKKAAMVDAVTDAVNQHNSAQESNFKAGSEFTIGALAKPEMRELDLREVYIDESKLNENAIADAEKSLGNQPNLNDVKMYWDPERGKYVSNNNNLLMAYLDLVFELKKREGDDRPIKFKVQVAVGPDGAPPKLATPAKVALKYLAPSLGDKLSESLIREADSADHMRYVIVDARRLGKEGTKGGAVRVMPGSGRGEISLKPHQLLVEVDTNGKGRLVAGGSLMSKYVNVESAVKRAEENGPQWKSGDIVDWIQRYVKADTAQPELLSRKRRDQILSVQKDSMGEWSYKMLGRGHRGQGLIASGRDILSPPTLGKSLDLERLPSAAERSRTLRLEDEVRDLTHKLENLAVKGLPTDPELTRRLEIKQGEVKSALAERIPEQALLGGVTGKFTTATGMRFDVGMAIKQAEDVIKQLRKFPLEEAPKDYVVSVANELKRLDIPLDVERFFRVIGAAGDDGKLILAKMSEVDSVVEDMQKLQTGHDRVQYICDLILKDRDMKKRPSPTLLTPDLRADQLSIEKPLRRVVKDYWAAAKKAAAEDPMGGSAMQRMLTITKMRAIIDFRKAALDIEEKTGVPLYTIHTWLSEQRGRKYTEQKAYEERLIPFVRLSPEEQVNIRRYYLSKYLRNDDWVEIHRNLTPEGQKMIIMLDELFRDMAPDIVNYRFKVWFDQNVVPRQMGLKTKGAKVFKRQNDPEVQALLKEGADAYMWARAKRDPEVWEAWLKKAVANNLGLVEEGRYLPLEILGVKPGNIERNNLLWHIDAAHGRFLSRGDIKGKEIDSVIEQFGHDKNLVLSVKNYVSQVLNVKYLDEGLQALNDIADAFPEMRSARRRGFLRSTPESRAYTTEEYLKLYTMRLKGYPVKMSMFETMLKDVQLTFFRALVVRPILWIRNLGQAVVNYPSKKFLDPRFTKFQFKKLPQEVQDWLIERGVDDSDAFSHSFLELETSLRINRVPIVGKIWDFAGWFGKGYAMTDTWNRKFVYTTTWFRSKFYMDKYKAGEINYEKLRNALDLDKLHPLEVLGIKNELTKGNTSEAAYQLAKWMTDNSQWKYSRYERGLDEMTGGGEALTNLFTWTKSMVQHTGDMGQRFLDAARRYRYADDPYAKRAATRQMLHATSDVAGIMLAGAITNGIYETLTVSHAGKYAPYGADMFTWQFGGVTGQILMEMSAKTGALVSAFDGTEQEKKRALDDWIKMADKIGVRQMMPFMKQTLAVIESLTDRSFVSPLYTLQSKFSSGYWRGLEKVDRTFLEGITHALFAVDPNKSEDVRQYTYAKLQELNRRAMTSTGVTKEWYELQVKRYEYLNDLFMRYQPVDVFRMAYEQENRNATYNAIEQYEKARYAYEKKSYRNEQVLR